jgi:hypothetical protein
MSTPESNMDSYYYKTNQNENLIFTNNLNSPNTENPYIISGLDDNFVIYKYNTPLCWIIMCMVSIPILIPFLISPLLRLEKKLEIKKNENNEIIVIITTYGNCTKTFNFPIENTAFEVRSDGIQEGLGQEQQKVKIIFYNTSLNEIDLDNSNIRNAPFQSIITFEGYIGNLYSEIQV